MRRGAVRFIDSARIKVVGGRGGNGAITYQHIISTKKRPDGGHGGRGGDVVIRTSTAVQSLKLPTIKYAASRGGNGGRQNMTGKIGSNVEILVPPGTMVSKMTRTKVIEEEEEGEMMIFQSRGLVEYTGDDDAGGEEFLQEEDDDTLDDDDVQPETIVEEELLIDLDSAGMTFVAAKGGRGGRGNVDFATASDRFLDREKFRKRIEGKPGEEFDLRLTLKSIAEVGLVGFPNAGKSTLLGALSKAKPEVANYPFTTLNPTVGVVEFSDGERLTVADIPGIVEGAHENRGLGHRFLRHIERTSILVFVVDCSVHSLFSDQPKLLEDENAIESIAPEQIIARIISTYHKLVVELELYMSGLSQKPSMLLLNKMDRVGAMQVGEAELFQAIVDFNAGSGELGLDVEESDSNESFPASEAGKHITVLPLPSEIFKISAKYGGGLRPFVHKLRTSVFDVREQEKQQRLESISRQAQIIEQPKQRHRRPRRKSKTASNERI